MKILLPVHGKEDGKLIADFVANYVWPPGAQIKAIHILENSADEGTAVAARQAAEELIAWFCGRLKSLVMSCELTAEIINGVATPVILHKASNWKANMIVMGHRANDLSSQAASVSQSVVTKALCSVVVIRAPQRSGTDETCHPTVIAAQLRLENSSRD